MGIIIQKYGGTSVENADRIRSSAGRIARTHNGGNQAVVVVSAMGDTTDRLIGISHEVSENPYAHRREMDMLLTAGERISMALLAAAISDLGVDAVSLTGEQAGIETDANHGRAKILRINPLRVRRELAEGKVVVVAGFQGVIPESEDETTLGRGGSDLTAVALAHVLGADACEIYTDVDGIYTANPRIVPNARKLDEISFDEMLELSARGFGVVAVRAVEFGRRFGVPIHVRSSFHEGEGTWIREVTMERAIVTGVASDASKAMITVPNVPDRPGVAASVFRVVGELGVRVDLISQGKAGDGRADISFTVAEAEADTAMEAAAEVADGLGSSPPVLDMDIAQVSIVGDGMNEEPLIAARMFEALAGMVINIELISSSERTVTCAVPQKCTEDAVRVLESEFDLPLMARGED